MPPLGCDFAWAKPSPAAVKAAGYTFVIGYISDDPAKDLDAAQITAYQEAGLGVLLVFETYARRSLEGPAAGIVDGLKAQARCAAVHYGDDVPVFFATDVDTTADAVRPYHRAVQSVRPCNGGYGGIKVVDPLLADGTLRYSWQACAWSNDPNGKALVSTTAHLYQRLRPTLTLAGSYDEDVLLRPIPMFTAPVPPQPAQPPTPAPSAQRFLGDDDMPFMIRTPDGEIDLVGGTLIHLDEAGVEFYTAQGIKEFNYRQADGDALRKAAQA